MRRAVPLVFFCAAFLTLNAQTASDSLREFASNIYQFNQIFPQEKVYIQFDNTSYYTGETIWFKAFVVEASTLHRAPSKVLYVELVSPTGVILKQQKLKIVHGQADGSFPLYDGSTSYVRDLRGVLPYPSGFYEVRAYTMNMLNFDEAAIFTRVLPVFEQPARNGDFYGEQPKIENHYNKSTEIEQFRPKQEKARSTVNATFYPEGGNLISGVRNRVAFKLTDKDGIGIDASGMLNDSVTLQTVHDGMGVFTYTPGKESGKVRFQYNGKEYSFDLPKPSPAGYALQCSSNNGTIDITVSNKGMGSRDSLGITITCRGGLYVFEIIDVTGNGANITIPVSDLPEGVCQLTLFDRNGVIYGRRSFYHRSGTRGPVLDFSILTDDNGPFLPVSLALNLRDSNGNPIRDRFCLSVRDSRCPGTAVHDDLRTALLLSSDIKGYVHDPDYYFEADDSAHNTALDLLMMVQGWERYDWETMSGIKPYKEIHRLEDSISVNGWVESPWARKPMDSIVVTAAVTTMDKSMIERFRYVTGPDGYFGFNVSDFYDAARLTISAWPRRKRLIGTSARIRLERSMKPAIRPYLQPETLLADASGKISSKLKNNDEKADEDLFPTVIDINDGILLPDVDIKDKRIYIDYFTFKAFNVHQDTELELDMGDYSTDVSGYLIDKGYSVEYSEEGDITRINGFSPYFYVHESQKVVIKGLFSSPGMIDTKDIVSIMVFDNVMYETDAMKLSPLLQEYRRKHGDYDTPETMEQKSHRRVLLVDILLKEEAQRAIRSELKNINSRVTTIDGYSAPYQFYSPEYPDGPVFGDVDYRRTLYWNPNVITDTQGNAEVSFYNNSYSTGFRVCGAGITAGGTPYVLDSGF